MLHQVPCHNKSSAPLQSRLGFLVHDKVNTDARKPGRERQEAEQFWLGFLVHDKVNTDARKPSRDRQEAEQF